MPQCYFCFFFPRPLDFQILWLVSAQDSCL